MPSSNKTNQQVGKELYLFTAEFPFGVKSETFLETEIKYLSQGFRKVIIFPGSKGDDSIRPLPDNVSINESISHLNFSGKNKWRALFRNLGIVLKVVFGELTFRNLFLFIGSSKALLDYLAQQLIVMEKLKADLTNKKDVVIYDYWFVDSTLALTMLKKKGIIHSIICRAHRFDLYDEASMAYGVPFRNWKMKMIDQLYLISEHGLKYARSKTSKNYQVKLKLSRLGVMGARVLPPFQNQPAKVIVSCSRMQDFKQVELIPQILKNLKIPVTWIHFGDGPMLEDVKKNLKGLPSHVKVELKGHKTNQEVLQFYESNQVDLFLSLSLSEGLPVSMMEAQSFGIPIVAYPVGGVPEIIVDGITGRSLDEGMDDAQLCKNIEEALQYDYDRHAIRTFFTEHFDASVNYTNFIREIGS